MMKNKIVCSIATALLAFSPAYADPPKGFEQFRQGILSDFDSFRSRILDHYADFLAGEWHEYEPLEGVDKFTEPKLSSMPVISIDEVVEGDAQKKEMLATYGFINDNPLKQQPIAPERQNLLDWLKQTNNLYNASPSARPATPAENQSANEPSSGNGNIMTEYGLVDNFDGDIFSFHSMNFAIPKVDFKIIPAITQPLQFSHQWNLLTEQEVAVELIPLFKNLQKRSGLSDYLLFELIMAYADHKFPDANDASKMSLTHYLLTNMEFAMRIAIDDNGQPFMLIPFDEQVFGASNLPLGKYTYFIFSTPGREIKTRTSLSTPTLPIEADLGKPMHLRMDGLTLPYDPVEYSFEYDGIKLQGEMNSNIIPMLYKYPKMDTSGFAASTILKDLRDDVVKQLKNQLGGMEPLRAADKLLAMIQFAFPYATDDDFHGFEKPYFFEETLFYPKSDCEDRAVFYSYLLWHALGLDNDLIAYPNHEATAIKAEQVWGGNTHYLRNGAKFFISDPTFQGAPTGNGMSRYNDTTPTIDLSYPQ